jgi:phosphate:Na+ symporter
MNWGEIRIWYLLAGLGLFLFGISLLEEAIKSIAGRSFKTFLRKQTGHPVKAVIAGALTTGVMQSSSMVTLLVMSFTGAGIIGLKNGIGMILGANLGTTITGWIVTLLGFKVNLENLFLPITAVGALGLIFSANIKAGQVFRFLFGFGLMFMGLEYMKQGFIDFAANADLSVLAGKPGVIFVLFGCLLAAGIRSSAAAMVIFLSSLASGSITLVQAAYLAVGADLGTSITGILGTINGNAFRRKTGWSQFYINVVTAIFTLILIHPLLQGIAWAGVHDPLIALVTFHSTFNLLGIVIILPFIGTFTDVINKYISNGQTSLTKYLPFSDPKDILSSIDTLEYETKHFIQQAHHVKKHFFEDPDNPESARAYFNLKDYENEIFTHATKLLQHALSNDDATEIQNLFSAIRSATLATKDIKDIGHNLTECRQSAHDVVFNLYQKMASQEIQFDRTFSSLLDGIPDDEQIADLRKENETTYSEMKKEAFEAYRQDPNFDLATLLNMVREVRDSRELFLKAFEQYLICRKSSIS